MDCDQDAALPQVSTTTTTTLNDQLGPTLGSVQLSAESSMNTTDHIYLVSIITSLDEVVARVANDTH